MEKCKNKIKIFIALSIIIILYIATAGIMMFSTKNYEEWSNAQNITLLATTNSPTIQMGTRKYLAGSTSSTVTSINYSQLTTSSTASTINESMTGNGTSTCTIDTASNKNNKHAYFDFSTKLVVPAYTKYTVKYTITCSAYKNAGNGSASGTYLKFYSFNSSTTTAASLYSDGTNMKFTCENATDNSYWVSGKFNSTTDYKKTISTTYEYSTTHSNKTGESVSVTRNYGYFASIAHATNIATSLRATISVTATITATEVGLEPPTDVTAQYTGQDVTMADVVGTQKNWFKPAMMTPDYSANADMKNLGKKIVKITITDPDEIFKGTPAEGTDESDTVRYITLEVIKKQIGVTIEDDLTVKPNVGAVFGGDTAENGRAPNFGFTYVSTDGKGYNSDKMPTAIGSYRATLCILNDCPYELDDTYTKEFDVEKRSIKRPTAPLASTLIYNGKTQEFELDYDSDNVIITAPEGTSFSPTDKIFRAKDAKTYNLTVSLKDNGVETKWADTVNDVEPFTLPLTISPATLAITFTTPDGGWSWHSYQEKTISITDNRKSDSGGKFDSLTYIVSCDGTAIAASKVVADSANPQKTNITIPALPGKVDRYSLTIALDDKASDASKNYTFGDVQPEQKFTVEAKQVTLEDSNIVWSYSNGGKTETLQEWNPLTTYEVSYNGYAYDFTARLTGVDADDGIVISKHETKKSGEIVESSKNAGEYTTTVTLTSSAVRLTKSTFTLTWKINKAKFDLSGVVWDYDPSKPREYNRGLDVTVALKNLPEELTPDYGNDTNKKKAVCPIDPDTQEYIPYKAQVTFKKLSADIADNYFLPVKSDSTSYICKDAEGQDKDFPWEIDWIIKRAELDLDGEWEREIYDDKNGVGFRLTKIGDETLASRVTYKYYAFDDWDAVNSVALGEPVDLEDIVVDLRNDPVIYWAVAVVNSSNDKNYEIKKGSEASQFTVGANVVIEVDMDESFVYDGKPHGVKSELKFDPNPDFADAIIDVAVKKYYKVENDNKVLIEAEDLQGSAPTDVGKYIVYIDFTAQTYQDNYALTKFNLSFEITQAELTVALKEGNFKYDGEEKRAQFTIKADSGADVSGVKIIATYYRGEELDESNMLADDELPRDAGKYVVALILDDESGNFKLKDGAVQLIMEIIKGKITANWDTSGDVPVLSELMEEQNEMIEYVYVDENGDEFDPEQLKPGEKYTAIARLKEEYEGNYEFVNAKGVVLDKPTEAERNFEIKAVDTNPVTNGTLGNMVEKVKDLLHWQIIVIIVCTILTAIFTAKTVGYVGKRKKFKKKSDKLNNVYAATYFGLAITAWTAIACVFIAITVLSFVVMIIAKIRCNKTEEEYEEHLDEYNRNKADIEARQRDESMRMILMGMMGNNANGSQGFAYGNQGISAEEMRLMINDAVTNMLPNVQQYLPQQASSNDELVEKLLEQNEKLMEQNAQNEERMRQMNEQNEERMRKLNEENQKQIQELMNKLAEKPAEKVIEREVAATTISDDTIEKLIHKLQINSSTVNEETILKVITQSGINLNDDSIKLLLKNQEMLMQKILELSANQNVEPQVVEKIVEKVVEVPVEKIVEVPVEVEKIVEKEVKVEVPVEVEKIVEKEIVKEVPVEKIVEREVKVEVPVEKIVEVPVEKIVEKEVKVVAPVKPKKEVAPRLTLDEAYALLAKQQKKYFDDLKAYAMSKDKCKEKKSTYFTVFGHNTANPLLKLTIKKNMVVALYKMEDEYMKDIRRNATSDGSKIKVKETELVVADAQSFKTAKEMIDLREDQIERYEDFLKEQKAMKNRR